jgi:uncharacterized protein YdhG (YjbR/CyaY superfamily)
MTVIDDYLNKVPADKRKLLEDLRKEMRKLLPNAEEAISYVLPCFKVDGKVVGGFAANKNFCSYYPFAGTTLGLLKKEPEEYSQTLSALHFTAEQPLSKGVFVYWLKRSFSKLRRATTKRISTPFTSIFI